MKMTDKNNNKKVRGKKNAGSGRTPHDEFVRKVFGNLDKAETLIKCALPNKILGHLDLSTLKQRSDTTVKKGLKKVVTDLQFECKTIDNNPARVIVLVEHKSYEDKYVSIQIMEYMLSIWKQTIKEAKRGDGKIPAIIPIIFYTGSKEWNIESLRKMFADTFYEEFIPDCKFIFFDVTRTDVKKLKSQLPDSAMLMLLRYMNVGTMDDLVRILKIILKKCKDEDLYPEDLEDFAIYYSYIATDEEIDELVDGLNEKGGEMTEYFKERFFGQRYLDLKQRYLELDQKYLDLNQKSLDLDQKYSDLDQKSLDIKAEGRVEGIDEANIHAMRMFVKKFQLTPIQALQALEISEQDWKRYLEGYSKKYPEVAISKQTVE